MKKAFPHILFAILILLALLPAVQMRWSPFTEKPLNGAFQLEEKPVFTKEAWMTGKFQNSIERYLKDHSGFRNFLVRLQNQVDFSLFRQANAEGAIVGKNKQLFEYDYIRSWLAIDYPGDSFLEKKLQRTRYVQDYLRREKGIDLIVVFEPGKASFYPEYLPTKYKKEKTGPSTYERYIQEAKETGIDFIDLHNYFIQLKEKSDYPLFPRYGTHWSVYGMKYAADSLLSLIEKRRNINLTDFTVDTIEISSIPRDTDDDVLKTMNLLFPLRGENLAYPVLSFDTLHPGDKPMVLVVADSYYWNIFNTRIPKHLFANEAFWYFNTVIYPDNYYQPTYTKDIDFQKEIEKQDVILLMITERFVHKFDWRLIDQLYALYTPGWLQDPVYNKINDIMQVAPWYADLIKKAGKWNATLEEALITDGKYLYHQSDTAGYMIHYGMEHYKKVISGDRVWMENIRKKAVKENISLEEALATDAAYIFEKDFPGLFEMNKGLNAATDKIFADQQAVARLMAEASAFRFDPDLFIRLKAWQLFHEEEIEKTCHAIRSEPKWLDDVNQKALRNGIPLEEMIRRDAEYIWEERVK